jgi:hypothetical protein
MGLCFSKKFDKLGGGDDIAQALWISLDIVSDCGKLVALRTPAPGGNEAFVAWFNWWINIWGSTFSWGVWNSSSNLKYLLELEHERPAQILNDNSAWTTLTYGLYIDRIQVRNRELAKVIDNLQPAKIPFRPLLEKLAEKFPL